MRSLSELSHALRHPETWPEGFKWDYTHCHSCALGLAKKLFPEVEEDAIWAIRRVFDIHPEESMVIFTGLAEPGKMSEITPERVADAIDQYVAHQEAVKISELNPITIEVTDKGWNTVEKLLKENE